MWFDGLDSVQQGVSASDSSPPVRGFPSLALTPKRKGCYGGCSLADQQQGRLCHVVGPLGSPIPLKGKLAASRLLRQDQSLSCRTGFDQTSAKKEALVTSTLVLGRLILLIIIPALYTWMLMSNPELASIIEKLIFLLVCILYKTRLIFAYLYNLDLYYWYETRLSSP